MSEAIHPGALALRRLRAGELQGVDADALNAHAEGCDHCRARLRALDEEQRHFEDAVSFDRFEAGVRRKAAPARWRYPALAAAALVLLAVGAGPLTGLLDDPHGPLNRTKGDDTGIELRISTGGDGPQRSAAPDVAEPLGPGERVRIGYRSGPRRFVLALSVDAQGQVSALYPAAGHSLPAERAEGPAWLPESLEFYGQGPERVIVVLSDEPLSVDAARAAAARAYSEAGGDVTALRDLAVPGEQFHRTLLKP